MKERHVFSVWVVFALVVSAVMLAGCSGAMRGRDRPGMAWDAHTGTRGVEMSFVQNSPPSQLFYSRRNIENPINVMIELRNMGAYDVSFGRVFIHGFDRSILQFDRTTEDYTGQLEGKTNFNPEGGYYMAGFNGRIVGMRMDRYPVTLVATTCYDYSTIANPLVCVDPRPYSTIETKACTVRPSSTGRGGGTGYVAGGGQGAPVAVTSVEQEATANTLYFRIRLQDTGGGMVVSEDAANLCPFNLEYNNLNKVRYEVTLGTAGAGSSVPRKCEPDEDGNVVRLVNGQATIYCIFEMPPGADSAYETPLNIRLYYSYKKSIERPVEIRNIDDSDYI